MTVEELLEEIQELQDENPGLDIRKLKCFDLNIMDIDSVEVCCDTFGECFVTIV